MVGDKAQCVCIDRVWHPNEVIGWVKKCERVLSNWGQRCSVPVVICVR